MFSLTKLKKLLTPHKKPQCIALQHTTTPQPIQMSHTPFKTPVATAAPPLIIMHGLFGSKANWNSLCKAFLKQLNPSRHVFSVDARNHGESAHSATHTYEDLVEDIRGFVDGLGVGRGALLGHSMGGRAVMLCALKYPQLVDKLIVADISPAKDTNFGSTPSLFNVLQNVNFPKNVSLSQARIDVEKQLAENVDNKGIRAFLLTNLAQKEDGSYGWRMNVPVLADSFVEHIGRFPDVGQAQFEGPVLFVAGGASDYVSNTCHFCAVNYKKMFRYSHHHPLKLQKRYCATAKPIEMSHTVYQPTPPPPSPPASLIIMHGVLGAKENFITICKGLKEKCTKPARSIVAVDARNHGASPHTQEHRYEDLVGDVKGLMGRLGLKRSGLLGHSMGGRAMMLFALKNPEMVDKLLVMDISPITTGKEMLKVPEILHILQNIKMPKNVSRAAARKTIGTQLTKSPICKPIANFILTNLIEDTGAKSFKWRLNLTALLDNYAQYISTFPHTGGATFDGRVLFVGGAKSDFIPKKDHPQIKKLFPKAEFVYIEGAGHWLHAEKPAEFLQICTQFLNNK